MPVYDEFFEKKQKKGFILTGVESDNLVVVWVDLEYGIGIFYEFIMRLRTHEP